MPHYLPRQIASPSGSVTIAADPNGTFSVDTIHTGTNSLLTTPTLTIQSTNPGTTSTLIASASSSSSTTTTSSSTVNTGAIIGLIVGIFVVLAVTLILYMNIRHKKQSKDSRARAMSTARKSWARLHDDREPAQLQMQETNIAKTTNIAYSNARAGEHSFPSLPSAHARILKNQAAPLSSNPVLAQEPSESGHTKESTSQPPSRSTEESHIPNPFKSPTGSPSHSPSPSHTSTYSSHAHSLSPAALSSFTPRTPQYAHATMITASSASDYLSEFSTPPDEPSHSAEVVENEQVPAAPAPARLVRTQTTKAAEDTRSRGLKAMQDLISALDERAENKNSPSAFDLRIDTRGKSRLSMGEDLVTPAGHSTRQDDAVLAYDEDGKAYRTHAPQSTFDQENFPLPPVDVFRAALSAGEAKGKDDKGKGKGKTDDPFRD